MDVNYEKISTLIDHGLEDRHEEVLKCHEQLNDLEKLDRLVMITYADALYELGDDLAALGAYLNMIEKHPNYKRLGFARFGAAMALKNINLEDQAFEMLLSINADHVGLNEELEASRRILETQSKAKEMLKQYKIE